MHVGMVAAIAAVVVGGGTVTALAVSGPVGTDAATVVKVVDGDTVDVAVHGTTERVRLLNVNAPESVKPNSPVECLGPEASAFLKRLLPVGTPVTLEYDSDRTDGYGRTLAAVRMKDGGLANSALAAAGLGVPMVVEPNHKYLPAVEAAFRTAESSHKGFFSPTQACTVPARTKELTAAVDEASADPSGVTRVQKAKLTSSALALSALLKAPTPSIEVRAVSRVGVSVEAAHRAVNAANGIVRQIDSRETKSPARRATAKPTARKPREPRRTAPRSTRTSVPSSSTSVRPTWSTSASHPSYTPPPRHTENPPVPSYTPPPTTTTSDPTPPHPGWTCRSYAPGGKWFRYIPCD